MKVHLTRLFGALFAAVVLASACGPTPDADGASPDDTTLNGVPVAASRSSRAAARPVEHGVTWIGQRDYPGIAETSCAEASLAMLLRFYYADSQADPRALYAEGIPGFDYDGPVAGWRRVSFATGDPDWTTVVPREFRRYYQGNYSGARSVDSIARVARLWGASTARVRSESDLYAALQRGPVLGRLYAHGNTSWAHYAVVTGFTATHVIVSDPYGVWNRTWDTANPRRRLIPRDEFFRRGRYRAPWWREGLEIVPNDDASNRAHTVVVSVGNHGALGWNAPHRLDIDDPADRDAGGDYSWRFSASASGAAISNREAGHAARWTPQLYAGDYEVTLIASGGAAGRATFTVYDALGRELAARAVDLPTDGAVLAERLALTPGAYARVADLPVGAALRAVRFRYLGPAR